MEVLTLVSLIDWRRIKEEYLIKYYLEMRWFRDEQAARITAAKDAFLEDMEHVNKFMLGGDVWATEEDWTRLSKIVSRCLKDDYI